MIFFILIKSLKTYIFILRLPVQINYRNATATIFKSTEVNDTLAPYVFSFSSRGPNPITSDILKVNLYEL